MNKEEIIIDGIDVSECKNYSPLEYLRTNNGYDEHPDYCGDYIDHICVNHPNCYYKQRERLKEENVKLKKALEEIKTFAKPIKENTCFEMHCGFIDFVLETISEVTAK